MTTTTSTSSTTVPGEQDLLVRREMVKNEKQQTGKSGTRAVAIPSNAKKSNDSMMSTAALIDYFITGAKETERMIGHERIQFHGKSLEEFRSEYYLSVERLYCVSFNKLFFKESCIIYAEIGVRQRYHPSFLNRNLSYLLEERRKPCKNKNK